MILKLRCILFKNTKQDKIKTDNPNELQDQPLALPKHRKVQNQKWKDLNIPNPNSKVISYSGQNVKHSTQRTHREP